MDFLTESQTNFNTSKKYEDLYIKLNEICDVKYHDLFILFATIGFKHNRKHAIIEKGRELKSTYFNLSQKMSAYTIILNDEKIGGSIERFEEKEFVAVARKTLEEYAEGGANIMVEEVFKNKFTDGTLNQNYDEYIIDIMSYIYGDNQEIPF